LKKREENVFQENSFPFAKKKLRQQQSENFSKQMISNLSFTRYITKVKASYHWRSQPKMFGGQNFSGRNLFICEFSQQVAHRLKHML